MILMDNNTPPFEVGDLVQMRSKDLKTHKFQHFPRNDFGVVISVKKPSITYLQDWLIEVIWQRYKRKTMIKHRRLKKVRIKKNA